MLQNIKISENYNLEENNMTNNLEIAKIN